MDVGLLLKVAGVGLIVSVAYQIMSKSGRDEMAMLISIAGIILVLTMLIREIASLFETIRGIFGI